MKKVIQIIIFIASIFLGISQDKNIIINEWFDLKGNPVEKGNDFDATKHIKSVKKPVVRIFRSHSKNKRGTILIFPGGGYGVLAIEKEGNLAAKFWNEQGFDGVVLEYQINHGEKTRDFALENAITTWKLITENATKMKISTKKTSVMGFSAGAHLAARLTENIYLNKNLKKPESIYLIYPAYLQERKKNSVLPIILPPNNPTKTKLFVFIAQNDHQEWVKSAEVYAKTWQGFGGKMSLILPEKGGHGFGFANMENGIGKILATELKKFSTENINDSSNLKKPNPATIPAQQNGTNQRHKNKIRQVKNNKFDLIFIGDSLIHTMDNYGGIYTGLYSIWQEFFTPLNALNLGYSAARTENIIWNLQNGELENQKAKLAIIQIGTNNVDEKNFSTRHNAKQVAGGIKKITEIIQEKMPDCKVIIMRPFPGSYDGAFPTSHRFILERAGDMLKKMADNKTIFYCDVNSVLLNPDGSINKNLMPDFVHPNEEGCHKWVSELDKTIKEVLK